MRNVLVHGGALIDVQFEGEKATPVVIKEEQRHPVRGPADPPRPARGAARRGDRGGRDIELLGVEDAPGVKEGGVLEHVTHEITIEALPTAIPESIPVDVSGMEIGDTLQLSAVERPPGRRVRRWRGSTPTRSRRHALAAAGRGGARARARGGGRAGRRGGRGLPEGEEAPAEGEGPPPRAIRAIRAARSSPVSLFRRRRRDGAGEEAGGRRGHRRPDRRSRQSRRRYAATRHNVGFEVAEPLSDRWELPRARERFRGLITEGRVRPGGPRVACSCRRPT